MGRKTHKRGKGGKYIAEGAFGCVVSPNYKCTSEDEVSHNKISKIFSDKEMFDLEIKESEKLKTIDPDSKYFFKIYKSCSFNTELNKNQIDRENEEECNLNSKGERYMYIGDNAGKDLSEPDFKSKKKFDKVLVNILEGLLLLKKNNLVHRDIKPANLSMTSDGRGMILDYGIVTSIPNSSDWKEHANLFFKGTPTHLPDENMFVLGFIINQDINFIRPSGMQPRLTEQQSNKSYKNNNINNLILSLKNNKYEQYFKSNGVEKDKSGYGTYIKETLTKKYNKLIENGNIDRKKYIKNYVSNYDKNDIFALGISLLQIIKKNKTKFIDNSGTEFYDMIDKMIEPDMDKRWNAEQILNHNYFSKIHINKLDINKLMNNAKNFHKKNAREILNQDIQNNEELSPSMNKLMNNAKNFHKKNTREILNQYQKNNKKIRKHQGIHQTGGNKGKLKKGYRYSGKKLKSGLPQIVKSKKR